MVISITAKRTRFSGKRSLANAGELAYVRHFRAQRVQALILAGSGREDREFGAAMPEADPGVRGPGRPRRRDRTSLRPR